MNRRHATGFVIFGAEDHAGAHAFELNRSTDSHRPDSARFENVRPSRFRRREDRRILLTFELARRIAFSRSDSDVRAGKDSAQSAAFESRLDDPETDRKSVV